ncbi:MAG: hypothetical protein WKF55_14840 [Gemmatimonadaceae bacterium]
MSLRSARGRWAGLRCLCLSVAAPILAAFPADAQARTPRQVAEAFFSNVAEGRWNAAAGLLDLDSFDAYRKSVIASSRKPQAEYGITAERLMRDDPKMPRAVAEYRVKEFEEAVKGTGQLTRYEFARISSPDSLAALTVTDAAARWIEAQDFRYQVWLADKNSVARGCPVTAASADSPGKVQPHRIVGVVVADSTAYIVHTDPRHEMTGTDPRSSNEAKMDPVSSGLAQWYAASPSVMRLRRVNGSWLIIGGHALLSSGFGVMVSCDPTP